MWSGASSFTWRISPNDIHWDLGVFFRPSEADGLNITVISLQIPCPFIELKHAWLDVKQTVSCDQK